MLYKGNMALIYIIEILDFFIHNKIKKLRIKSYINISHINKNVQNERDHKGE